jgi:putative pyruvate formate lyase activating enzyme
MLTAASSRFVVRSSSPSYLDPEVRRTMPQRVAAALQELECCCACPRNCKINRLANETKICNTGRHARVASAFPHFGEEDCLRGWRGSGTIFFSLCNLRCVFCQNWDISQRAAGRELDASGIADLMLALQEKACHNINFVTPEHVAPQVVEAIAVAVDRGLRLPIVYNTSSYDALASLRLMDGLVDIYMPDLKFWSPQTAMTLAKAKDYPQRARDAIKEMHRQVGELRFDSDGVAVRGLLVRHLVMPGLVDEAAEVFRWLAEEVSADTYVNIMGQYRPDDEVGKIAGEGRRDAGEVRYVQVNRQPQEPELREAYAAARAVGLWRFAERWL